MAEELEMVARLNSHESNLINRMDKHAKAAINTHVPGFLDCSRVVPVITMYTEDILYNGSGMACRTPEDA